jgi:hypothetical protein
MFMANPFMPALVLERSKWVALVSAIKKRQLAEVISF